MRRDRVGLSLLLPCITMVLVACSKDPDYLDIATTTTLRNSGVFAELMPHFKGAIVRVHATDSRGAIDALYDEVVDLVITHDSEAEGRALREQPAWAYQKFAYNDLVLVGPADDPANVRQAADLEDAFRRIAPAPVTYVSRDDDSRMREMERRLWRNVTVGQPPPQRVLITRLGLVNALQGASERHGYVITDEATFWRHETQLDLAVLFKREKSLRNTYAVAYQRSNDRARRFGEWLTRGEGRKRIRDFRVQGRPVFTVWPEGCPGVDARDEPCRLSAAGKPIKDETIIIDGAGPPATLDAMKADADAIVLATYTGASHEFSEPFSLPRFERLGEFEVLEVLKPHPAVPGTGARVEIVVPGSYQEFPGYIRHTYSEDVDEPLPRHSYVIFIRHLGLRKEGVLIPAWQGGFYDVSGDVRGLASSWLEERYRTPKALLTALRAN